MRTENPVILEINVANLMYNSKFCENFLGKFIFNGTKDIPRTNSPNDMNKGSFFWHAITVY